MRAEFGGTEVANKAGVDEPRVNASFGEQFFDEQSIGFFGGNVMAHVKGYATERHCLKELCENLPGLDFVLKAGWRGQAERFIEQQRERFVLFTPQHLVPCFVEAFGFGVNSRDDFFPATAGKG